VKEVLQGLASSTVRWPQGSVELSNSLRIFFIGQLWMSTYEIETNLGTYTLQFIDKSTYLSFGEINLSLGERNRSGDRSAIEIEL